MGNKKVVKAIAEALEKALDGFDIKEKNDNNCAYVLLDRSGSMGGNWVETIGSVNAYIDGLQKGTQVYFAVFDDVSFDVVRSGQAESIDPISTSEVTARGCTPLYDAAGKVMKKMIDDNPSRAVFMVMTDGYENASREHNLSSVKGLMKNLEKNDWPIVFLGADFSKVSDYATRTFGIASTNTYNTTARTRGLAMTMNAVKTNAYFGGDESAMAWTEAEKALVETDDAPEGASK